MSKPSQPKWLADVSWNFEHGQTLEVWQDGNRFVIIRFPGHKYWSDRMNPSTYAAVCYYLHDKQAARPAMELLMTKVHEGRLLKIDADRLRRMCELSEDAGEKVIVTHGKRKNG